MKEAVWLIAHGSNQEQTVKNLINITYKVNTELPITISSLKGNKEQTIEEGYKQLIALNIKKVIVVPLFVSSGSRHIEEIQEILYKYMDKFVFEFTSCIDDHPYAISHIITTAKQQSLDPTNEVLLLIGHGSEDLTINENWLQLLESMAARVKSNSSYKDVRFATILPNTINDELSNIEESLTGLTTIIVPLLIDRGVYTDIKIPSYIEGYKAIYNGNTYMSGEWLHKWIESKLKNTNN